jgi:3-hydroxyacyl-CoA dehydrogenase / 3-hydroxy-2-methylbutyryl-CoA dehydrogenase
MLRNVCAIVSGGSSGLGAAAAAHIVKHGGKVVVADLPGSRDNFWTVTKTWAEIEDHDVPCKIYIKDNMPSGSDNNTTTSSPVLAFSETDVTNADQVSRALDVAEEVFGQPVNTAINCAGIGVAKKTLSRVKKEPSKQEGDDQRGMFQAHPPELFSKALEVNVVGTFNVARLAAERMAMRSNPEVGYPDGLRGCIINTASIAAYEGQTGQVAYAASKGAIVSMTLPMARDLASIGIRVMTIVRITRLMMKREEWSVSPVIRVNVLIQTLFSVSSQLLVRQAPGLFRTPLLAGLPEAVQTELGASVPLPSRLGDPMEFGSLVGTILTNPMLNGSVIRLDGALRMPP